MLACPQDLLSDIGKKLRWKEQDFKDALVAMLVPPAENDARTLYEAMKGLGTDEAKLNEILISRNQKVRQ